MLNLRASPAPIQILDESRSFFNMDSDEARSSKPLPAFAHRWPRTSLVFQRGSKGNMRPELKP